MKLKKNIIIGIIISGLISSFLLSVPTVQAACLVTTSQTMCSQANGIPNPTACGELDDDVYVCCCADGVATTTFTQTVNDLKREQDKKGVTKIEFIPQVTIPGSEFQQNTPLQLVNSTAPIANYIKAIYNYSIAIVGILAAIMLMIGGLIWITSEGNSGKVDQAKSFIISSLTGMILVLTAYMMLKTINPDLVKFKATKITIVKAIEFMKCCKVGGDPNVIQSGGLEMIKVQLDEAGNKFFVGTTIAAKCSEGAQEVPPGKDCIGVGGTYKLVDAGEECGSRNPKGRCYPEEPELEGLEDDGQEDCPEGKVCYYWDTDERMTGQTCGDPQTRYPALQAYCMTEDNRLLTRCRPGYDHVSGGVSCGNDIYCCRNACIADESDTAKGWVIGQALPDGTPSQDSDSVICFGGKPAPYVYSGGYWQYKPRALGETCGNGGKSLIGKDCSKNYGKCYSGTECTTAGGEDTGGPPCAAGLICCCD